MATPEIAAVPSTHPSVLLALFPDALLPPHTGKFAAARGWRPVTCSDTQVEVKKLATLELAWAVWALRERGSIVLAPMQKSQGVLFFKRSYPTLGVHRTGGGAAEGVESQLLEAMPTNPDGSDVADIVYRWLGQDFAGPFHEVADRVERHGRAPGYFEAVDTHEGTVGRLLGRAKTRLEPCCDVIAAARSGFDQCLARWLQFASSEPDMHRDLLAACERGISNRKRDDSDYGSID